jgi:hypothetical protein
MNNLPVILAHGARGGLLGFILVAGIVVLIVGLAISERSQRAAKKD